MDRDLFSVDELTELVNTVNQLKVQAGLLEQLPLPIQTASRQKDELMDQYDQYQPPIWSRTAYEVYKAEQLRTLLSNARQRNARRRLQGRQPDNADEDFYKQKKDYIVEENGSWYGFDFGANDFDRLNPLEYPKVVKFEEHSPHFVEYYTDSNFLNLTQTLLNLLQYGRKRGFGYKQLAKILYQMVCVHFPEKKAGIVSFHQNDNARDIFKVLVETLDPTVEDKNLEAAKNKIVRRPGDDISVISEKLQSINMQVVTLYRPTLDLREKTAKAENITMSDLKNYITEDLRTRYKAWLRVKLKEQRTLTLLERIRRIQQLEIDHPSLRPKTALTRKDVEGVDMEKLVNVVSQKRKSQSSPGRSGGSRRTSQSPGRGRSQSSGRRSFSQSPSKYMRRSSSWSPSRRWNSPGGPERRNSSANKDPSINFTWNERSGSGNSAEARGEARKNSSPGPSSSALKDPSRGPDKRCLYCYSNRHLKAQCWRYSNKTATEYCKHCLSRGYKLLHASDFCKYNVGSKYRSPSPATRRARINILKQKQKNASKN